MDLFEWVKEGFQDIAEALIDFLPTSPIVFLQTSPEIKKYLGMLNWFIPIYTMIGITEAWLTAIGLYYIVQIILRWVKAIE